VLKDIGLVVVLGTVFFVSALVWLRQTVPAMQEGNRVLSQLRLIERPVQFSVLEKPAPNPSPLKPDESILQRIRRRKVIRVGFNEDKIPFAFFNRRNRLVGYDINMAHALARDLGVRIEFVRFDRTTLVKQLRDDHFDVVMSGLVGTLERAERMQHTSGYLDVNLSLVVPDYRARKFRSLKSMREMDALRIGFVDLSRGFVNRVRRSLPDAEIIKIDNIRDFFDNRNPSLDALLVSAETGSAFSLLYPNFEVVVPQEIHAKLPLFYAIGNRDAEMREFLEHWIMLRKKDGTAEEFYNHWILGKTAHAKPRRWCVIRNVLGWVK
jgi:ABC-type amino acid transport substrate-binding protein